MGWWQWARYRQDRNEDPREQLQAAVAAFESIPESARDYDFHLDLGLVFKVWADSEDGRGGDSLPFRDEGHRVLPAGAGRWMRSGRMRGSTWAPRT